MPPASRGWPWRCSARFRAPTRRARRRTAPLPRSAQGRAAVTACRRPCRPGSRPRAAAVVRQALVERAGASSAATTTWSKSLREARAPASRPMRRRSSSWARRCCTSPATRSEAVPVAARRPCACAPTTRRRTASWASRCTAWASTPKRWRPSTRRYGSTPTYFEDRPAAPPPTRRAKRWRHRRPPSPYPVFCSPAAMPLTVSATRRAAPRRSGCVLRQRAQPAQQAHLHQAQRIHVGIAQADRAAQHRRVLAAAREPRGDADRALGAVPLRQASRPKTRSRSSSGSTRPA